MLRYWEMYQSAPVAHHEPWLGATRTSNRIQVVGCGLGTDMKKSRTAVAVRNGGPMAQWSGS
jgi:hypothetical protein